MRQYRYTCHKILTVIFMTFLMIFSMIIGSAPVLAEETYKVTINESSDGHVYSAYQIFAGSVGSQNVDGENQTVLSNITAGTGLKADADASAPNKSLVAELQQSDALKTKAGIKDLTASASAEDVAEAIDAADLSSAEASALSKILYQFRTTTVAGTSIKTDNGYEISGLPGGYYLICDSAAEGASPASISTIMLKVIGNAEVKPKTGVPQIVKKVYDPDYHQNDTVSIGGKSIELGEGFNDVTDANVYDDVTFEVISTLPENYDSYNHYYYAIVDDLDPSFIPYSAVSADVDLPANVPGEGGKSETIDDKNLGLAENASYDELDTGKNVYSLSYKTGSGTWKKYEGNVRTAVFHPKDDPEKTRIMVVFPDLKQQSDVTKDTVFRLTYLATLDLNAKIGNTVGNQNTAKLSYSNDPQSLTSIAETPKDLDVVFTYELDIHKISSRTILNGGNTPIANVPFALYQMQGNDKYYLAVRKQKDTDNKYLCGGWDTKDSIDIKTDSKVTDEDTGIDYSYVLYSDVDGNIPIKGLDAGTYYIEELEAPDGYNKLSEPVQIQITSQKHNTQKLLNSTDGSTNLIESIPEAVTSLSGKALTQKNGTYVEDKTVAEASTANVSTGIIPIFVKNKPEGGITLPSTGGTGSRMFHLLGLGLIGIGIVLLAMKKKKTV